MQLYFATANVPLEQWTILAATNMEGLAALWVQANANPMALLQTPWDEFVQGLCHALLPSDVQNRYMAQFLAIAQGNSTIDDYSMCFRKGLLFVGGVPNRLACV